MAKYLRLLWKLHLTAVLNGGDLLLQSLLHQREHTGFIEPQRAAPISIPAGACLGAAVVPYLQAQLLWDGSGEQFTHMTHLLGRVFCGH